MHIVQAIRRLLRQCSVYACYHAVYASFYILGVQTRRFYKNGFRRFKKRGRRFLIRLLRTMFVLFVKPFCVMWGIFTARGPRKLYCFVNGIGRLVALTAVVAFAIGTLQVYLYLKPAYRVIYRGEDIGFVASTETLTEGLKYAGRMMQFLELESTPTLSPAVSTAETILSAEQLGDSIINCHRDVLDDASGLFVDGNYIAAVSDKAQLEQLLEKMRTAQDTGEECKPSAFKQKVEVLDGAYPKDTIVTAETLQGMLTENTTSSTYYTVKSGDTLTSVARAHGLSLGELRRRNPAYENSDVIHVGDRLLVETSAAVLQVSRYLKKTYVETIPFETRVQFNDNFYVDEERIFVKGVNGSQQVTAEIEYTDGVETGRTVLTATVLKKPVTQKMRIGTQKGSRPDGSGVASGKMTWPVPHFTTITSYYGARWGTVHQGLDISGYNVYGASIVAADGGVVYAVNRSSKWGTGMFSGYGYAVIIDHGNGLRTLYAHCSKIAVKAGQRVSKGQVIAYVGNTGKSTGPHLHFEVRKNNRRVDPLNYLK